MLKESHNLMEFDLKNSEMISSSFSDEKSTSDNSKQFSKFSSQNCENKTNDCLFDNNQLEIENGQNGIEKQKKNKLINHANNFEDGMESEDCTTGEEDKNKTQQLTKKKKTNAFKKQEFTLKTIEFWSKFVEKPLDSYQCFMCQGDMMIEIHNDQDIEKIQQRRLRYFSNFKPLQSGERVGDSIRLVLNSKENVITDLNPIINMLESKQDSYLYYFAQLLKKYNEFTKGLTTYIQSIIDAYSPDNYNELNLVRELRYTYHIDYMDKQISQKVNDEFYCSVQVGPNFKNKAAAYNILQFSKAMVALLGADEEQMIRINLRYGFRDFIFSENVYDMYIKYLEGVVNGAANCEQSDMMSFETKLFTYDHIVIPCTCLIKRHIVPLPKQLEYKSTTGQYFNLDMINYMVFQIDHKEIKRVLDMRAQSNYQEIIKEQVDDLEYSVRSQIFLEKFYPQ